MNIRNLVSENVFNQLSLYAGRLRTSIDETMNEIDYVSEFIRVCGEYENDLDIAYGNPIVLDLNQTDIDIILDFENNILSNGITIADAEGNLTQFYLGDEPSGIKTIYIKDSIYPDGFPWLELIDNRVRLAWDISHDYTNESTHTIYDLFMSRWSGYLSEMSMWYDVVTSFLNGGWNNVSEMTSLLQDRINNASINLTTNFQDLKDSIAAASSCGLAGIAQAITTKLGMASTWSASDTYTIDYSTVTNWHITDINWNVIAKGLLTASQYLGQLMLFVGGPIVKAIGTGITLTTKLIDFAADTISTSSQAEVNDKSWLASWYGDIHLYYDTLDTFKTKFPKITTLPAIIDTGLIKILATPAVNNNVDVVDYRIYDCPLYSPDLLPLLIQDIITYYGLNTSNLVSLQNRFMSQNYEWVCMNAQYSYDPIDWVRMNTLYTSIINHCTSKSIDTDIFDQYNDGDKRTCYTISLLLMSFYLTFSVRTVSSAAPNIVRVLPIWFFDNTLLGTAWNDITDWLDGSAIYPNSEVVGDLSVGVTPFEMIAIPLCGQYLKLSALTIPSWNQLVTIKNWMSTNLNAYTLHDFIDNRVWSSLGIYHVEKTTGNTFNQVSYSYTSHIGYRDFDLFLDVYNDNWCYANGSQIIIRYNPPQITYALAQFIRIMGISISAAIIAGMAVVAYKAITRNKRQANLYARYNKAISAYNDDPTAENYKWVKKTTRLLKRDITFFGSSKYLSSLSGAAFGWGTDGSLPAVNSVTSLINTGQNFLNGSSSEDLNKLRTVINLISGD